MVPLNYFYDSSFSFLFYEVLSPPPPLKKRFSRPFPRAFARVHALARDDDDDDDDAFVKKKKKRDHDFDRVANHLSPSHGHVQRRQSLRSRLEQTQSRLGVGLENQTFPKGTQRREFPATDTVDSRFRFVPDVHAQREGLRRWTVFDRIWFTSADV